MASRRRPTTGPVIRGRRRTVARLEELSEAGTAVAGGAETPEPEPEPDEKPKRGRPRKKADE